MSEKRKEPLQKRSIEKRNLILKSGFTLMIQKGYHNTTTDDIAKEAGISTGIIYRYFSNKKELLLAALEMFINSMEENYFKISPRQESADIRSLLTVVLDRFITLHIENKAFHEEMETLRYTDADFTKGYSRFNQLLLTYLANLLPDKITNSPHSKENIWMTFQLIESYCHARIRSSDNLDFNYLKNQILDQSVTILEQSANAD